MVTEGYRHRVIGAACPAADPPPVHPVSTKRPVIYGVSCVCVGSQKHGFSLCFVASADPIFFVGESFKKKRCFYVVFGSAAEGSGKEKL